MENKDASGIVGIAAMVVEPFSEVVKFQEPCIMHAMGYIWPLEFNSAFCDSGPPNPRIESSARLDSGKAVLAFLLPAANSVNLECIVAMRSG